MSAHLAVAVLLALLASTAHASDVPSFPLSQAQSPSNSSSPSNASSPPCHLDLSAELFGGVAAACGAGGGPGSLDRGRCCPVLAAWLFAAHARTALSLPPAPPPSALSGEEGLGPGDEGCAVRAPDTSSPRAAPCGVLGGEAGAPVRILEGAAATCRSGRRRGV